MNEHLIEDNKLAIGNRYIDARGHVVTIVALIPSADLITFSYNNKNYIIEYDECPASTFLSAIKYYKRSFKIKNMPKEEL